MFILSIFSENWGKIFLEIFGIWGENTKQYLVFAEKHQISKYQTFDFDIPSQKKTIYQKILQSKVCLY